MRDAQRRDSLANDQSRGDVLTRIIGARLVWTVSMISALSMRLEVDAGDAEAAGRISGVAKTPVLRRPIRGARVLSVANLNDATAPGTNAPLQGRRATNGRSSFRSPPVDRCGRRPCRPCRVRPSERLTCEMWRAASSAVAQRLWLTTSTLCPSGSRTNAP